MASREGFEQFVRSQPADRPCCHDQWSTCAVGAYAESIGFNVIEVVGTLYRAYGTGNRDAQLTYGGQFIIGGSTVMDKLDMGYKWLPDETYGGIQKLLDLKRDV